MLLMFLCLRYFDQNSTRPCGFVLANDFLVCRTPKKGLVRCRINLALMLLVYVGNDLPNMVFILSIADGTLAKWSTGEPIKM